MEYQKIINLLDNTSNQHQINHLNLGQTIGLKKMMTYMEHITNNQTNIPIQHITSSHIKFKTSMLKSSLCHYNVYILVGGTISVEDTSATGAAANNTNRNVKFKNCAPFTDCRSKINNTKVDNAKDIDVVKSMYNLIEYSNNYSKTASLWKYYRDEPSYNNQ